MQFYAYYQDGVLVGLNATEERVSGKATPISMEKFIELGGTIPNLDKTPVEQLQQENQLLKAQVQAMENQYQFLEDCIAEMAAQVY